MYMRREKRSRQMIQSGGPFSRCIPTQLSLLLTDRNPHALQGIALPSGRNWRNYLSYSCMYQEIITVTPIFNPVERKNSYQQKFQQVTYPIEKGT